jgi:hypothetical protein
MGVELGQVCAFFSIFSTMVGTIEIARMLPEPTMREKVLASARELLCAAFDFWSRIGSGTDANAVTTGKSRSAVLKCCKKSNARIEGAVGSCSGRMVGKPEVTVAQNIGS